MGKLSSALEQRPKTVQELYEEMGKKPEHKGLILSAIKEGKIELRSPHLNRPLIVSITVLILIEIIPQPIRGGLALIMLFLIPYFWTKLLLRQLEINHQFTTGLVIAETISIGFILGFNNILYQLAISICMMLSVLIKYVIVYYLRYVKSG